jgi:predicted nucleotidyltransferase
VVPDALRIDLDRYVALLEGRFGSDLVSVVVFGSRVRGQAKPESDIDVLVVIRGLPLNRFERYGGFRDIAERVSAIFARDVSLILLTPEEPRG